LIWLSGQLGVVLDADKRNDLGVMCQPGSTSVDGQLRRVRQSGIWWAVDNAVFGGKFDPLRWEAWLRAGPRAARLTCLFAVAPDVLHHERGPDGKIVRVWGDPEATYALSPQYFPLLRSLAYRVAFVSQDGATAELVPWDDIDCLFIGGSNAWKFSDASLALVREAQERGLWVHAGRVQASRRLKTAHAVGIDSADGTSLAFEPGRIHRAIRNIEATNAQPPLLEALA
jgi:hypothetical protein